MSDARAATDGDLEYWRDTVRSARATNTGTLLAATASMEALLARISADAARIRELEAALCACADDLEAELNNRYPPAIRKYPCMEIDYQRDMHSVHEARAMLAAAPRP